MPRSKPHSEHTKIKIGNANRKAVYYNCDNCKIECVTKPSHYNRKKTHFCSMKCYKEYVKSLPFTKQNAYRGVRKEGQSKQVYHSNYVKKHPKRISHLKARRYAREKGAEGSHTLEQWLNLREEFDNKCAFCRQKKFLTKDHIIPLSEGGTDFIDNIQPLCQNCNSRKWKFILKNPELLESEK
jgi:5-methylcytosine-specific restriction endonuclease McrA